MQHGNVMMGHMRGGMGMQPRDLAPGIRIP